MQSPPPTGTTNIVILEDTTVGSILAVVRATDADVGTNADIQYNIAGGNDLGVNYKSLQTNTQDSLILSFHREV